MGLIKMCETSRVVVISNIENNNEGEIDKIIDYILCNLKGKCEVFWKLFFIVHSKEDLSNRENI